jgi:aspartyl-tRNA(Asn)/glutamyl-tRNA(Gln) amidotransferase subunit A
MNLTITQLREKLLKKEISAKEIVQYYLDRIEKLDKSLNTYISVFADTSLKQAEELDNNFDKLKENKFAGCTNICKRHILHKGTLHYSSF